MLDVNHKSTPPSCVETEAVRSLNRLKEVGEPITVTVSGGITYTIQDDAAFEHLVGFVQWMENVQELNERLKYFDEGGKGLSIEEARAAFRNRK